VRPQEAWPRIKSGVTRFLLVDWGRADHPKVAFSYTPGFCHDRFASGVPTDFRRRDRFL